MKTMEVAASNTQLRKVLERAQGQTLVLTQNGKPIAALVPMEGMDAESLAMGTSPKFLRTLRRSFRELDAGKRVGLAEMRKRLKA